MRLLAILTAISCTMAFGDDPGESHPQKAGPGQVLLFGKRVDTDKFLKMCRETTGAAIKSGSREGRPVKVTGTINLINDSGLVLVTERRGKPETAIAVDMREVGGIPDDVKDRFRPGHRVEVYGLGGDDGDVRGWFLFMSPPGLRWQYKLRKPNIVVAGDVQEFQVDCIVKNTGTQPLENVEFTARLWQVASPNDELNSHVIPRILPGQTARFAVPFVIYNYQAIGWTSVPRVEGKVTSYEIGRARKNR